MSPYCNETLTPEHIHRNRTAMRMMQFDGNGVLSTIRPKRSRAAQAINCSLEASPGKAKSAARRLTQRAVTKQATHQRKEVGSPCISVRHNVGLYLHVGVRGQFGPTRRGRVTSPRLLQCRRP